MSKLLFHKPKSSAYYKQLYLLFKRNKSRFIVKLVYIIYFIFRRRYKYNNNKKLNSRYHKNAKNSRIKNYIMKFTKQNKL